MNIFILFLIILMSNAIDGRYCKEQICTSSTNYWCCFYNATCGPNNTCSDIIRAVDRSSCRGRISCSYGLANWCCENDQTCGDVHKCYDDNSWVTLVIILCSTIGSAIFTLSCIFCLFKYHQRVDNSNARFGVRIANASAIVNSLRHRTTERSTPFTQVFIIATATKTTENTEESPPSYDTVTTPSTEPNRDSV